MSEILAFMKMFELDEYDYRKVFLARIQCLDSTYLGWSNDKQQGKSNGQSTKHSHKARQKKLSRS